MSHTDRDVFFLPALNKNVFSLSPTAEPLSPDSVPSAPPSLITLKGACSAALINGESCGFLSSVKFH